MPHNLAGILETAIRGTNTQYEPQHILGRLDVKLLEIQPGDTGWDVFSLDYKVSNSLFHNQQLTSKLAALLTQAVYTPNQSGVKVSEFFSGKSSVATLFSCPEQLLKSSCLSVRLSVGPLVR